MRILITGVTGFAGSHLAELLLAGGDIELHGTSLSAHWPPGCERLAECVAMHVGDLSQPAHVESVLRALRPEQIYHLAGYAASGQSFREPDAAWNGNFTATQSLLDGVRSSGTSPRVLHVSTGLIYAPSEPPDQSIAENAPLSPNNPYAMSKAAGDRLAEQYAAEHGLDIVRVRPFNHIGPRQSPQFAVASFAQQLARIELGHAPPRLETGDLTARRDFTDVRDMVRAYVFLMARGQRSEVYNIGSGSAVSMVHVLDMLRQECATPVEVVTAADRLRPTDHAVLIADSAKLRQTTGWSPRIPLVDSLRDTLQYWREVERGIGG